MQQRDPSLHKGHRDRMRQRFLSGGLENFQDYEVLEMLLFHSIAQKDVNELAHRLLNQFGSLTGVLNASIEELRSVEGVGERSAVLIHFTKELVVRYLCEMNSPNKKCVFSYDVMLEYFRPRFVDKKDECLLVMSLDAQHRLLNCSEVASGDFGRVNVSVRNVIRRVIEDNASYVVLAHNHPNALATPSSADISCTLDLVKALHAVGVSMETHFIFGKNGTCFNMAESPDHSYVFKTNWRGLQSEIKY